MSWLISIYVHFVVLILVYIHHKRGIIGASMEVNISHRSRQEILTTVDLAHPDLFRNALGEIVQLLKMVGFTFSIDLLSVIL